MQSNGVEGGGAPGDARELERLIHELAQNARATAALLTRPRYDEAELAELDVRARTLRAAIAAERQRLEPDEATDLAGRYTRLGPLCGG